MKEERITGVEGRGGRVGEDTEDWGDENEGRRGGGRGEAVKMSGRVRQCGILLGYF